MARMVLILTAGLLGFVVLPLTFVTEPVRAQTNLGAQLLTALGGSAFWTTGRVLALAAGQVVRSTVVCMWSGWCGVALMSGLLLIAAYKWYRDNVTYPVPTGGAWREWYPTDAGGYYFKVQGKFTENTSGFYTPCSGTLTGSPPTDYYVVSFKSSTSGSWWDKSWAANETVSCPALPSHLGSLASRFRGVGGANPFASPNTPQSANAPTQQQANDWANGNAAAAAAGAVGAMNGAADSGALAAAGVTGDPAFTTSSPSVPGTGSATAPTQDSQAQQTGWLGAKLDAVTSTLRAVMQAVMDLPGQIIDGIRAALEELFLPTSLSTAAWEGLVATIQTKPPFSLLPPATLFDADTGSETCAMPDLSLDMTPTAGVALTIPWPSFVCDIAAIFRLAMKALIYLSAGWWAVNKWMPGVSFS